MCGIAGAVRLVGKAAASPVSEYFVEQALGLRRLLNPPAPIVGNAASANPVGLRLCCTAEQMANMMAAPPQALAELL